MHAVSLRTVEKLPFSRGAIASALTCACLLAGALLSPSASAHHYDSLLPERGVCPGERREKGPEHYMARAARCLINEVREKRDLRRLETVSKLKRATQAKADDIDRCGYSHYACGRDAFYWDRRFGYTSASRWRLSENLRWARRGRRTARQAVSGWLHSDPHRHALLARQYREQGVGLEGASTSGSKGRVFVAHLGCRGC